MATFQLHANKPLKPTREDFLKLQVRLIEALPDWPVKLVMLPGELGMACEVTKREDFKVYFRPCVMPGLAAAGYIDYTSQNNTVWSQSGVDFGTMVYALTKNDAVPQGPATA